MDLVFATNNQHKLKELQAILGDEFRLLSLKDIGCDEEIPEEQSTLEGNASQKSFYIFDKYGYNCFADDTGLEIEALDKRPGVYSARYAGIGCTFDDNVNKILSELNNIENRKAKFRTVIALVENNVTYTFEGEVNGHIINEKRGEKGFGYDPVFLPDGYNKTFAEMELDIKNTISHRAKAIEKFVSFLKAR